MEKQTILLVDDEESICLSLKFYLTEKGYDVDTVPSGEEAIEKLEQNPSYNLLITDLMMPGKSGVDVFKKGLEINVNIPVFIITGYDDSFLFKEAMQLKPCGYALKPFSQEEILKKVLICFEKVN